MLSISRLFADDTSLTFTSSNLQDLEGVLNHDYQIISAWSKQWLVDFNLNKTEAILFTLEQSIDPPLLLFDQTQVKFVDYNKHLGLTFSFNGKWHEHINAILSSAAKILGMMCRLKFTLNRKSLNQISLLQQSYGINYPCTFVKKIPSSFKSSLLRNIFVAVTFPKYFVYGIRKRSVIHFRIRNKCSDLNHDLFLNRLRGNEICDCGFEK